MTLKPIRTEHERALLEAVRLLLSCVAIDAKGNLVVSNFSPLSNAIFSLRALLAQADQEDGKS
jgi:hypothetical protein